MKVVWKVAVWIVKQAIAFFVVFGLMLSLAKAAQWTVTSASQVSWFLGVVAGSLVLAAIVGLWIVVLLSTSPEAPAWTRGFTLARTPKARGGLMEQFPAQSMTALFLASLLAAVLVLAPLSELLAAHGLCAYERTGKSRLPLAELLFRMYAWHTIDALPVLDVWEVVKIRPNLKPADTSAQLLVLAYRLAVVGLGISALAQWLSIRKDRRKRARRERAVNRGSRARTQRSRG
jgi:hypothetical protein